MKFILVYVIVLLFFSANEVLSDPSDFCKNKKLEDGTQIPEGSCSLGIQGDIPSSAKMASTLIVSPGNEAVLVANAPFSVDVAINNLETGFFSDPEKEYNIFPQSLTDQGVIKGHSHVTIQQIDNSSPPDSATFAFFKGLNQQSQGGHLTVDVVREDGTPGLPAGRFRICTMSSSFSHQPLVMPIAKRGAQDDCIRINVGAIVTPISGTIPAENGKGKEPIPAENGKGKEPIPAENGKGKEPIPAENGKGKQPIPAENGKGKEPIPAENGKGKEPIPAENGKGKEPNGKGRNKRRRK